MSRVGRYKSGFTIVELVVVIVIIGILAGIVTVGLNRYTTTTRDTQRQAKATVISEALEKYYEANGEYPGCSTLSSTASVTGSAVTGLTGPLSGVDQNTVVTPTAGGGTTNSITCTDLTSITGSDVFAYVGDGSSTCNATTGNTSCLSYTLKYKDETTGQIDTITSRHTTNIATSGSTTLTIGTPSFTTDALSWTAVPNASGYDVQKASDSGFTIGVTTVPAGNVTSFSVTGLSPGSTQFYRIRPTFVNSQAGNWSNKVNDTTWQLAAPTMTAGTIGPNSLAYSWTSVPRADGYNYQLASDAGFSTIIDSGNTTTGLTNTTSGLTTGTTYYVRSRATAAASPTPSAWSNVITPTTVVPVPTCTASSLNSNTQITVSWNAVSVATSYNLQYATNSGFSGATTITGLTSTSKAITGLSNATTYYFQVQAVKGSITSLYGSCPAATTGIDGPFNYGWYADGYGVRNSGSGTWMAYPGAGNYYSEGMTIYGSCSPGATIVTRLYLYYATSSNGSPNTASLMDWTWGNQDRFAAGGKNSQGWYVWWQGWVACQSGSTRVGDTYLGNPGPYN